MDAKDLKKKYLDFFVKKGHAKLPNLSLVPENDPSTLFISAGMQPLVPYLLGEPHPQGKKLVSLQRCLRTGDIDLVGNVFHSTFFEMLGNWSLGDPASPDGVGRGGYWKEESLSMSLEFLTKVLGLDKKRLHVTVFAGDKDAPRDTESEKIWLALGVPKERIYALPKEDNWWEAGATGPGGPDSEIFYDLQNPPCGPDCRPGDNCGRFFEMWNNVFMEYDRRSDGTYEKLAQKNVDTGMGVERTAVVLEGRDDVFETTPFRPLIQKVEEISGQKYEGAFLKAMRIVTDHLRASVFLVADGVMPSNVEQGYVLRRLIRRAVRAGRTLGIDSSLTPRLAGVIIEKYRKDYPRLLEERELILSELEKEECRFDQCLVKGTKEFEKISSQIGRRRVLSGEAAFRLYESCGFPLELTKELAEEKGLKVDEPAFRLAQQAHQKKSRESTTGMFKGGLADHSERVTKLHTTTHLLHQVLRDVLGKHVRQIGSNITAERLRFDFSHPEKLTDEQIQKIEKIINEKIKANLPVKMKTMRVEEAKKRGALALFGERYQERVKTYAVGSFSFEICGGPHVSSTGQIGSVKIKKEKAVGEGRRRLYVELDDLPAKILKRKTKSREKKI